MAAWLIFGVTYASYRKEMTAMLVEHDEAIRRIVNDLSAADASLKKACRQTNGC